MTIDIDKYATHMLKMAINKLPELLLSDKWKSYYIDAEEPIVERMWNSFYADWRVCLHRIRPSNKAFYHPHRHPTAILICKGSYEMGVGYGEPDGTPPPIFGPIVLKAWDYYQMAHPHNWHYIKTLKGPSYSIMVTGEPYEKNRVINRPKPRELTEKEQKRILKFFTPEVLYKASSVVEKLDDSTTVNLGAN